MFIAAPLILVFDEQAGAFEGCSDRVDLGDLYRRTVLELFYRFMPRETYLIADFYSYSFIFFPLFCFSPLIRD